MLVRRFYFNVNNNLLLVFLFLSSFSSLSMKLLVRPTDGKSSSELSIFSLKNQLKSITTLEAVKKKVQKTFPFVASFSSRSVLLISLNLDLFFKKMSDLYNISNIFNLFFCFDRYFLNLKWDNFNFILQDKNFFFKIFLFIHFYSFKVLLSITKTNFIL